MAMSRSCLATSNFKKLVTNQRKGIMVLVTFKETNWIQKQSGVTAIIRNLRENKHR